MFFEKSLTIKLNFWWELFKKSKNDKYLEHEIKNIYDLLGGQKFMDQVRISGERSEIEKLKDMKSKDNVLK